MSYHRDQYYARLTIAFAVFVVIFLVCMKVWEIPTYLVAKKQHSILQRDFVVAKAKSHLYEIWDVEDAHNPGYRTIYVRDATGITMIPNYEKSLKEFCESGYFFSQKRQHTRLGFVSRNPPNK